MIVLLQFVLDYRAVLAVNHENRFFDLNPLNFISEGRKRIETKLRQIAKPLRMDNPWILVRRQLKRPAIDEKNFFQFGEQHHPADGRLRRGDKQSVIATSVQSDDGRGSKPAQPVSLQPFAPQSRV